MNNKERRQEIKALSQIFGFDIQIDDMFFKAFNKVTINVLVLNNQFAKQDSKYRPASFTYRGEANVSMMDYIEKKYGTAIKNRVNKLI